MFKYDNFLSLLFAATFFSGPGYGLLEIKELKVPAAVRNGDVDELILDCDFIAKNVSGIEVKWFYNGDKDQVYQWIPGGTAKGYPMGSLKNHIDATFQVTNDKSTMYRALKLRNVTHELTGSYTCKVSGYTEEAIETKNLTIYVPPSDGLNLTVIPEDLSAICSVSGVFPEPTISLIIRKGPDCDTLRSNADDRQSVNDYFVECKRTWTTVYQQNCPSTHMNDHPVGEKDVLWFIEDLRKETLSRSNTENTADIKINEVVEQKNGLFNKAATMTFENNSLVSTSEFICVMKIPGTEYEITETRLFSQDNFGARPYLPFGLLQLTLLLMFLW